MILKTKNSAMTANLIDAIQQKLGYPVLDQMDPNTQEAKHPDQISGGLKKLVQAAIPSVLIALKKYIRRPESITEVMHGSSPDWLQSFFGDKKQAAVQRISEYANATPEQTQSEMERIASTAVSSLRERLPQNANADDITKYMAGQQSVILSRLPAALQLGDLLGDDSLDDRTHKMQGPISTLMHKIEDSFSGSTRAKGENF
jgi:hypothetical protein